MDKVWIAVVNREDYIRVMKKAEVKESQNRIEFAKKIPFFKNFSYHQTKNLMSTVKEETFTRNQYVFT